MSTVLPLFAKRKLTRLASFVVNYPFSISDTLERIIPGATLWVVLLRDALPDLMSQAEAAPILAAAFALFLSYIVGVFVNVVSGFFSFLNIRHSGPEHLERDLLSESFESVFGKSFDQNAWRLCYGLVIKHEYTINTKLFAGIQVFCSSMFVVAAICSAVELFRFMFLAGSQFYPVFWIVGAVVFALGARRYSRAFTESIYEAFFSWYCDTRKNVQ